VLPLFLRKDLPHLGSVAPERAEEALKLLEISWSAARCLSPQHSRLIVRSFFLSYSRKQYSVLGEPELIRALHAARPSCGLLEDYTFICFSGTSSLPTQSYSSQTGICRAHSDRSTGATERAKAGGRPATGGIRPRAGSGSGAVRISPSARSQPHHLRGPSSSPFACSFFRS
jgi:hypothetical protein